MERLKIEGENSVKFEFEDINKSYRKCIKLSIISNKNQFLFYDFLSIIFCVPFVVQTETKINSLIGEVWREKIFWTNLCILIPFVSLCDKESPKVLPKWKEKTVKDIEQKFNRLVHANLLTFRQAFHSLTNVLFITNSELFI